MLGAIVGDVVGSVYEWHQTKRKDFEPLFPEDCFFTDDSVLTVAVADALLNQHDPAEALKSWGREYPNAGYGGLFHQWLFSEEMGPYNSFGNGAAMRVSPVALLARTLEEALQMSDHVTAVTHNHPEGLKGARATVTAIVMAREGCSPEEIRRAIATRFGYDMDRTVDQIRPDYSFDETCQRTVPEAILCVLEATDFEDAIRNAISLGGDSDTLGAIAGPVAEARFGLPPEIASQAWQRLDEPMQEVIAQLYARAGRPLPVDA